MLLKDLDSLGSIVYFGQWALKNRITETWTRTYLICNHVNLKFCSSIFVLLCPNFSQIFDLQKHGHIYNFFGNVIWKWLLQVTFLMRGPRGLFNSVVAAAAVDLMLMYMGMSTQIYRKPPMGNLHQWGSPIDDDAPLMMMLLGRQWPGLVRPDVWICE